MSGQAAKGRRPGSEVVVWVVAGASAAAAALAAHSVINWRLLRKAPAEPTPAESRPSVSVLIPARDEGHRLATTLTAALAQRGVALEIIVLDDGSTDDTAAVARRIAGDDPRFRLCSGAPLPPGWLGKPHACWQLAQEARGEVLAFLDADVLLAPDALATCVDMLHQGGMDMLSPYPRQEAHTVAERLTQPLLQWSWLTFLPLRLAERSTRESLTAGNGQLIVCRADSYRAAGGHAQVRDAVIEDVGLARALTRTGLRVGMADGTHLASCRMYEGWPEVREGYRKSLWSAFGSRHGAIGVLCLLGMLYLLPPLALLVGVVRRQPGLAVAGGSGYVAAIAGRAFVAWRTGGRVLDAPTHPASMAVLGWLTITSWRHKSRGALSWKGRPV